MVDSINNNGLANSLLRAQQAANTTAVNSTRQVQTINNLPQKSAVVPVKLSVITQSNRSASSNAVLPRGSIVDRLV